MNGYSKIKVIGQTKSRSIDFPDPLSFPSQPFTENSIKNTSDKSPEEPALFPRSPQKNNNQIKRKNNNSTPLDSFKEQQEDEDGDEKEEDSINGETKFGAVLTRNCSVSSSSSTFGLQYSAAKKAFSMRRSSSVSEAYCRIHHQSATLASSIEDDDNDNDVHSSNEGSTTSMNKKKKQRAVKILKACKRLFGLH